MEFEAGYRYPQQANIGFPLQQFQYNGRNTVLSFPNNARPNPRVCPVRGPIGGMRGHMRGGRDEENENGQVRRRVAVACARCRKRKIRCSGDPGDGTGCQNCNSAGVDPTLCAFHRVGSGEATSMIDLRHNLNLVNANSHAMMQLYNPPTSPVRSRPLTYPSGLDTKAVYHQSWYNSPYTSEETSPVDTYGLDQPNGYLPNQNAIACNGNYDWTTDNKPALSNFMGQDTTMFRAQAFPYMQHNIRAAASSEALSHSMASIQLTIPERPHTRSGLPVSQRPQLPIPQPAQKSRNVVDQLQDQRLRSAQAMGRSSFSSGSFIKPSLPFNGDTGVPVTSSAEVLAAQNNASTPASSADSATCYPTIAPTNTEEISVSTGSSFTFSTSPLFDAMTAPSQPTYSNFRDSQDHKPATSSSTKIMTPMARQVSHTDLYRIGNSSNSRGSLGGNASTLVSGHQYTPLSHSQPHHQAKSNQPIYPAHRIPTATRSY